MFVTVQHTKMSMLGLIQSIAKSTTRKLGTSNMGRMIQRPTQTLVQAETAERQRVQVNHMATMKI